MTHRPTVRRTTTTTLALLLTAGSLGLAGCSADDAAADATTDTTADGTSTQADAVSVEDAWVKAADEGMSAAFGEITNDGENEIVIVSATTEVSPVTELHETAADGSGEMSMTEVNGGFPVAPGETLTLEPGGNHIMLMDLTDPIQAGDEVTFTLTFADDSTTSLAAPVKDFTGAEESYEGDADGATGHEDS